MFFARRLSSLGGLKFIIRNYREKYFWTSSCVLCREGVLNLESALSEIPLDNNNA
jgi:hypothetical protein